MDVYGTGAANRILNVLSPADRILIARSLQEVKLGQNDRLEEAQTSVTHAYFVETGMASVVATGHASQRIEVGMIGFEGMTGLGLVLGVDSSPNETLVQSAGLAWRITAADLEQALQSSATLRATLMRYVQTFSVQTTQTALANGCGRIEQRLARSILMWSDRLRSKDVPVTHEFLALLLGVRRPSATTALHRLEGRHLIRSDRGLIHLYDRAGLVVAAHGFYGVPEAEYDRIMEPVLH